MSETPLLILGGNGMLGQALATVFADKNPVVWDRIDCDITNQEEVSAKLLRFTPRIIINAAAYNFVDVAETEPGKTFAEAVNGTAPRLLAKYANVLGATLVHYSTDYVFDGTKKEGYREDDRPNPQSVYAKTKWDGEQNVLQSGATAYIIRTCKLFGQTGQGEGSKQSFVDLMLTQAIKTKEFFIVDEEYASPTYVFDLAAQTRLLLEGLYMPGIYHITNSSACTWYEFAQEIFRLTGSHVTLHPVNGDYYPRSAHRPLFSQLLNTKLPPMRSWQKALAAYLSERLLTFPA